MNEIKKKILEGIMILILCFCPIIITGCGAGSCVRCTACGDDDTRFFVYASGTTSDGVEYTSCVGPAGCTGLGLNTFLWPTECTSVKGTDEFQDDSENITGCVTYYNETGCIGKSGVKSKGTYTSSVSVFGINCGGTKYVETIAESTKAYEQGSCLGCTCGEKDNDVELRDYNNSMPRSFTKGCWTND